SSAEHTDKEGRNGLFSRDPGLSGFEHVGLEVVDEGLPGFGRQRQLDAGVRRVADQHAVVAGVHLDAVAIGALGAPPPPTVALITYVDHHACLPDSQSQLTVTAGPGAFKTMYA